MVRAFPPLVLSAWVAVGCGGEPLPKIALQLGPGIQLPFTPRTALVRYAEHATAPDEMRLLLASYEMGCSDYTPPKPGEVLVTVTVRVPSGEAIEPGTFPWTGDLKAFAAVESGAALPFVRLAEEGRALPAGGELRLDTVEKRQHGEVAGELRFQDGGDGETRTAGLTGGFRARICELSLDESRRKKDD